jgi:hypothetical protein
VRCQEILVNDRPDLFPQDRQLSVVTCGHTMKERKIKGRG